MTLDKIEARDATQDGMTAERGGHTVGEWLIGPDAGHKGNRRIYTSDGVAIAKVYASDASDHEGRAAANASLISAAPDLLAALVDARSQLEQYEQDLTGESYNDLEINAAITKAQQVRS